MTRRAMLGLALWVASSMTLGVGCKKKKNETPSTTTPSAASTGTQPEPAPVPEEAPKLTIHVTSGERGNDGRPVYGLVRDVAFKDFVEDRYQDIADLVIKPDESVLERFVVYPGMTLDVTIDKPEGKTVGVYLLLTKATGTSWKRLFEEPESIEVVVGRDRLLLASEQKEQGDAIENLGQ